MTRITETLARVPLFASLPPEAIRRLDSQCAWRRAAAKETILTHQDEDRDVYFVVSGALRVVLGQETDRDVIFRDLEAGHFFGEIAALDGRPRSASVVALTDVTTARMPAAVYVETVLTHRDVALQTLRMMAERVRHLSERVDEFSHLPAKHRVYAELLRLSRPDRASPGAAVVSPPPYHAEIAARVGTRRETVAREMKALERQGLLQRRTGAFVLTDPPRLRRWIEEAREGGEG